MPWCLLSVRYSIRYQVLRPKLVDVNHLELLPTDSLVLWIVMTEAIFIMRLVYQTYRQAAAYTTVVYPRRL